jgi:hypothetical protein
MVRKAVFLCVLAIAFPLNAGERLAMRLTPAMALEPAVLTVRTTVEADADNRMLEVVAQSADFYRSSSIQLDGANASRLNVFEFKSLPSGVYDVTSILIDSHGRQLVAARTFRVASSPGSSR